MIDKLSAPEIKIMRFLYYEPGKESYLSEIARHDGKKPGWAHVYLAKLIEKDIVSKRPRLYGDGVMGVVQPYGLTEAGEALAWALCNPKQLLRTYLENYKKFE